MSWPLGIRDEMGDGDPGLRFHLITFTGLRYLLLLFLLLFLHSCTLGRCDRVMMAGQ